MCAYLCTCNASAAAEDEATTSRGRTGSVRRRRQVVARTIMAEQVRARIRRIRRMSENDEDDVSCKWFKNKLPIENFASRNNASICLLDFVTLAYIVGVRAKREGKEASNGN